ncbi:MAG TPA: isoaspartyl peptidase/L-asparaginase [Candidatus Acidoferrales bacterium]|nr:isoaspartyl peptidase/L-asparaginase [Candidatus Acidoferrales bacterium]
MNEYIIASDWVWGVQAVVKGRKKLAQGSTAVDAVEAGICVVEDDPTCNSVGTGGLPNAEGVLELDASIMDGVTMKAGGVTCLTKTRNPISVARKVMELTPHVLLAGTGATEFARRCGFGEYDPQTPKSITQWKELRSKVFGATTDEDARQNYINLTSEHYGRTTVLGLTKALRSGLIESRGTVGALAVDQHRRTCAGTSTSGWPLRFPGRVADSSIIGAGTYANKAAAASATGIGETAMRHCLTKEVCDLVTQGKSPTDACETALLRIIRNETFDHLAAVFCVNAKFEVGGACTRAGFQYEYMTNTSTEPVIVIPQPVKT